jgi:hypothetical protein
VSIIGDNGCTCLQTGGGMDRIGVLAFGKEWPADFEALLGGIYVLGTIRNKQVEMVNTEDSK